MKRSDQPVATEIDLIGDDLKHENLPAEAQSYDECLEAWTAQLNPKTRYECNIVSALAGCQHDIARLRLISSLVGRYDTARLLFDYLAFDKEALAGEVIDGNWANVLTKATIEPEFPNNVHTYNKGHD